ncbi:MAG: hypothetical protein GY807_16775, partial [Gammaproteobacteria bacterium]|nr:hypothetical protein [Gammaproteobacteria bacterium]
WDIENEEVLITLPGHRASITDLSWSPDGRRLTSSSVDSNILIWDMERGQELTSFTNKPKLVWGIVWSPDGQYLAVGSQDGKIYVLPNSFTQPPCQWLTGHNFSLEQWVLYRGYALYRPTCPNLITPDTSIFDFDADDFIFRIILTLPGRLLLFGITILALLIIGLLLWGSLRMVRWAVKKSRQYRPVT